MAKGVNATGFITYMVIFLILTVGISRVKAKKPPCIEGRTAYVSPGPCSDSLCTQDCRPAGYHTGKCKVEWPTPLCKCYGCRKV
ncbi:unnamed protein product [Arabidopsis thaliana]|uniref:(thale cress) hypothetical protein n=1 Tax=Arabidopsis thaliana TaxID=3702 RepID=A0A7G2EEB5_ARATH|nr:unnamed protein product [Arabidopsis thaliana]